MSAPARPVRVPLHALVYAGIAIGVSAVPHGQVDVLTQHNDLRRSGVNAAETVLSPATVSSGRFGRLAARLVDGNIYAQPLVVTRVAVPTRPAPTTAVIVATEHNSVYAFDGTDVDPASEQALLWHTGPETLGPAVPAHVLSHAIAGGPNRCVDLTPEVGITSTPALALEPGNPRRGTVFVVAKTRTADIGPGRAGFSGSAGDDRYAYTLHALDLGSGRPLGPGTIVEGYVDGSGNGSLNHDGRRRIVFDARIHLNRPALLLHGDVLFVAFGSHCDRQAYHGWLFAYDVSVRAAPVLLDVFCTTPNGRGRRRGAGGIWMSGQGPAVDGEGRLYLSTGDGGYDGITEFGSSILALHFVGNRFYVRDWFTPRSHEFLSRRDVDLGSTGVALLDRAPLLLAASKEGRMYVIDRRRMGRAVDGPLHALQVTNTPQPPSRPDTFWNVHGAPIVWERDEETFVYVWGEEDRLRQYRLVADGDESGNWRLEPVAASRERTPFPNPPDGLYDRSRHGADAVWMPGAFLSLTSDGERGDTGIVWASMPVDGDANHHTMPGRLRAYDAMNVERLLWDSTRPEDHPGMFAKFVPPTIANGLVYLATFQEETGGDGHTPRQARPDGQPAALVIYGLRDDPGIAR